jgi:ribosome-binding protein aMBF1 (putative translation factor)
MDKNKQKSTTNNKKQSEFDSVFEKYAKTLSKDYVKQFEKPEFKTKSEKQKVNDALRSGKNVEIVQKSTGNKAHAMNLNIPKILDDEHVLEIKEVPKEIASQVAQHRLEQKLSQEQLAKKIFEKTSVINDIEKAEGVYDPKIIEKIEKALGVKFTRSWKK